MSVGHPPAAGLRADNTSCPISGEMLPLPLPVDKMQESRMKTATARNKWLYVFSH